MAPGLHMSDMSRTRTTGDDESVAREEEPLAREAESLDEVLDSFLSAAEGEEIKLAKLLRTSGRRSFGPLLVVPGIMLILPTGAIPGMPIVLGALAALVAVQLAVGTRRPWLPKKLLSISIPRRTLEESVRRMRPWARRIDRPFQSRLEFLVEPPFVNLIGAICAVIGIAVWVIGLIPFAIMVPGAAITLFGLAIMARDGLVSLIALLTGFASLWFLLRALGWA